MMNNLAHRESGFALIEILVALAIVGIALPALMLRMQSIANTTEFIESRSVAYWVAENKMQEFIADQYLTKSVSKIRKDQDTLEYDNQEWHWSVIVEELDLGDALGSKKMFRIVIDVGLNPEESLASLTGYIGE